MIRAARRIAVEVLSLLLWRWTYPIPAVETLATVTPLPLPPQAHYTPQTVDETPDHLAAAQDEAIRIAETGFECFDPACKVCTASTHEDLIIAVREQMTQLRQGNR